MNYYYQLELLAGLFVMSSFIIGMALWSIVCEMKLARQQRYNFWRYKYDTDKKEDPTSSIWRTP